jgi:hypothetical protein
MRKSFLFFIWFLFGSLVGFFDTLLRFSTFFSAYVPFFLISFWIPFSVYREDDFFIFKVLPSFLIVDFYSPTPFGIISIALWSGFYLVRVFFKKIFNTVSLAPLLISTFVCCLLVRSVEVAIITVLSIFQKTPPLFSLDYGFTMLQEGLVTAVLAGIFFLVFKIFLGHTRKLHKPSYAQL